MVTREQVRGHTGRQPFLPFWVRLANGEMLYVIERFRAVVMPQQMVVSPDGRGLRWIPLEHVVEHGLLSGATGAAGNGTHT